MKIYRLALLASLIMLCSSCGLSFGDEITIESCTDVELIGFTGLKATFGFRNESRRTVTLQDVTIKLKKGETAIGSIELKEDVKIPSRTSLVEIPTLWRLYDVNIIAAISASSKIANGKTDSFLVDIQAKVKTGLFKRNVELNSIPLSELKRMIK